MNAAKNGHRTQLIVNDLTVDPENFCVRRKNETLNLSPRAFDLFCFLIRNSDRVVEKSEIFETVWAGTSVTDNALTRVVSELRQALGDDPAEPRFIRTVPKRGYHFIAEINASPKKTAGPAAQRISRWVASVAFAVLLLVAIGVPAAIALSEFRRELILANTPIDSVAVLPFRVDDASLEMLAEHLSSELADKLLQGRLRVMPKSSVQAIKLDKDPQITGRILGVRAVLIGKLETKNGLTVADLELLDSEQKAHLWGGTFVIEEADGDAALDAVAGSLGRYLERYQLGLSPARPRFSF